MSGPTPEYDAYEELAMVRFRDFLQQTVRPIAIQRDQLADEVVRLRKENSQLMGRLMWYSSTDSAHDPDHGIVRPPDTPVIEEDH